VYGYFVTDGGTPAKVLAAERFDTPVVIAKSGDGVTVVASVNFGIENAHEGGTILT
jgi:hypothetical protein